MQTDKQALMRAYCQTRDPALRNTLAEEYLYLSKAVAHRFAGRGMEMEDLVQVASIALLHALERFDCEKGLAFSTFAVPTLAGEVRNFLRDKSHIVRMPRRGSELLPRVIREREAFFQAEQREPLVHELAARLQLPQAHVQDALDMQRKAQPVSLDTSPTDAESPLNTYLGQEEAAYERIDETDMVESLLEKLEEKSRYVIQERFIRQRSQRDIAQDLGVSQMQVSRLERKALDSLRKLTVQ